MIQTGKIKPLTHSRSRPDSLWSARPGTAFNETRSDFIKRLSTAKSSRTLKEVTNLGYRKNINEFRHLIPGDTEPNLQWALELRRSAQSQTRLSANGPPRFYEKDEGVHKKKRQQKDVLDIPGWHGNINEVQHISKNKLGKQPNSSQLRFETSLRPSSNARGRWNNITYKEHISSIDPPKSLPKWKEVVSLAKKDPVKMFKTDNRKVITRDLSHRTMPKFSDDTTMRHAHKLRHNFVAGATQGSINWLLNLRS